MSTRAYHVYGIGNAIMDMQLSISEQEFETLGLEKSSMNLVDESRQQEIIAGISSTGINRASGGSAANTIIALAELGARTSYCCLVGNDQNGKDYLNELQSLGVTTHVAPIPNATTGTSLILITPDAERTMNTNLGVSSELHPEHISQEIIAQSDWLYVEGYLFASPTGAQAALAAIDCAKKNSVKVAVTFSDAFIVQVFGESLRSAVAQADLVFANVREAQAFTGHEDPQACFDALAQNVSLVAVTMSEKGALVGDAMSCAHVQATAIKEVDATGAGDMFAGGFLYGITHGKTPAEAGKLACYLGSLVVAQLGPRLQGDLKKIAQDCLP